MQNDAYKRLLSDVTRFLAELQHTSGPAMLARKREGLGLVQRYNRLKATGGLPAKDDKLTDLMTAEMPWSPDHE